jgi:hypothetical protein
MKVCLSTDETGIRNTHGLTGRWNDRPWNGFDAGTVRALAVAAGVGTAGDYAVTVELIEVSMPKGARTADFAAVLGAVEVSRS